MASLNSGIGFSLIIRGDLVSKNKLLITPKELIEMTDDQFAEFVKIDKEVIQKLSFFLLFKWFGLFIIFVQRNGSKHKKEIKLV